MLRKREKPLTAQAPAVVSFFGGGKLKVDPDEFSPDEWDFRKVKPEQLDAAIRYEYARSCDWVVELFKQWREKRFEPDKKDAALRRWSGWTIKRLISRRDKQELPQQVLDWASENTPPEIDTLHLLIDIYPLFPEKPFLKIESPQTFFASDLRCSKASACWEPRSNPGFLLSRWMNLPDDEAYRKQPNDTPPFIRLMLVDLRFSKDKICKDFSKLLNSIDCTSIEKFDLETGKKAALPWHRLKELAAYRLAKLTNIKFSNVKGFVRDYKTKHPEEGKPDVLPGYGQGGFSDAVKSAEDYINHLYPYRSTVR